MRGCVLAGGAGRRLGGAKATAPLAGRPLIAYPLAALAAGGLDPVVVAKPGTELPPLDVPVVSEPEPTVHPIAGILAALRELDRPVLVCAVDMPFVTAALARSLAAIEAPLVVPEAGGRLQPLLGRYTPAVAEPLEHALAAAAPLTRAVASLEPRIVAEAELRTLGDPARLLANVNTPRDLRAAERALATG